MSCSHRVIRNADPHVGHQDCLLHRHEDLPGLNSLDNVCVRMRGTLTKESETRAGNEKHGVELNGTSCGASSGSTMQYQLELEAQ